MARNCGRGGCCIITPNFGLMLWGDLVNVYGGCDREWGQFKDPKLVFWGPQVTREGDNSLACGLSSTCFNSLCLLSQIWWR